MRTKAVADHKYDLFRIAGSKQRVDQFPIHGAEGCTVTVVVEAPSCDNDRERPVGEWRKLIAQRLACVKPRCLPPQLTARLFGSFKRGPVKAFYISARKAIGERLRPLAKNAAAFCQYSVLRPSHMQKIFAG